MVAGSGRHHRISHRRSSLAAVVVTYRPSLAVVRNLHRLAGRVQRLYVVDNSPRGYWRRLEVQPRPANLQLIELHGNLGIAAALNFGFARARAEGCRWLITLDQDSLLSREALGALAREAAQAPADVAIIAARILDHNSGRIILDKQDEWIPRRMNVVITSGNIVRVQAWARVGGFDWRLFIDSVDFDFCLRLYRAGYTIRRSDKALLEHHLGSRRAVSLPGQRTLQVRYYPPFRRYFQIRNGLVVVLRYWHSAPAWCLEHLLRLILVVVKMVLVERRGLPALRAALVDFRRGTVADLPPARQASPAGHRFSRRLGLAAIQGAFRRYWPR